MVSHLSICNSRKALLSLGLEEPRQEGGNLPKAWDMDCTAEAGVVVDLPVEARPMDEVAFWLKLKAQRRCLLKFMKINISTSHQFLPSHLLPVHPFGKSTWCLEGRSGWEMYTVPYSSGHCHLLAGWPRESHSASLSLSFLICKMG